MITRLINLGFNFETKKNNHLQWDVFAFEPRKLPPYRLLAQNGLDSRLLRLFQYFFFV